MYQFSRAIYRELAGDISEPSSGAPEVDNHRAVLEACESAIKRLATDRHYFARPARTLFNDVRQYFPINMQRRVYEVVCAYIGGAEQYLAENPYAGNDVGGEPLPCRATTRRGTPCQRAPLARNGYCASHQHLAETEDAEQLAAA
jgi:hypothetical protein